MAETTKVWMPLYWGDYLRDTGHLSAAQHGAYLMLIGHYWVTRQSLPDDDSQLARISKMTPDEWRDARSIVLAFFELVDGRWHHERVEAELHTWTKKKAKRSQKAKAAADARWNPSSNPPGNAPSIPEAMLGSCPSPSPSSIKDAAADARPREATLTPVAALIRAFDAARSEAFGKHHERPWPDPQDSSTATRWLEAGVTVEMVLPIFEARMKAMAARSPTRPPRSLRYFEQAVADAIDAAQQPMPQGETNGQPTRQTSRGRAADNFDAAVSAARRVIARKQHGS